mmetsp:Transcript_18144/g.20986  ORF Transcript_18144/g.20986 Transcript_18144/m.20986 type:complete len:750 (-) Transcript_18144:113-2362(-)
MSCIHVTQNKSNNAVKIKTCRKRDNYFFYERITQQKNMFLCLCITLVADYMLRIPRVAVSVNAFTIDTIGVSRHCSSSTAECCIGKFSMSSPSSFIVSKKNRIVMKDMSGATTTEANNSQSISKEDLKFFTVKQLKEKIKEMNLPIKTSHLKLKGDIIDFLFEQYSKNLVNHDNDENHTIESLVSGHKPNAVETEAAVMNVDKPVEQQRRRRTPLPPLTNNNANNNIAKPKGPSSPKDIIFEQVLKRYPPLNEIQSVIKAKEAGENSVDDLETMLSLNPNVLKGLTGLGDMDTRQRYHPMLTNLTSSDLDIVTAGTASCVPGVTRGVSCTALRLQWRRSKSKDGATTGGIWIFDCGESTQLQIQRTGSIRPGKISKIFITHAHGDHSFGLPGLLCIMGQDRDRDGPPLEIYGPEGLRMWLRTSIRYSVSRIVPPYRVHELMDIPMAPEWKQGRYGNRYLHELDPRSRGNKRKSQWGTQGLAGEDPASWISRAPMLNIEASPQFGEIEGGRDIYPIYNHPKCVDGAPIWEVEDEGDVKVFAAPMSHGVPCVGYVVDEENKPGRLRNDLVEPIVTRNFKALKESGMRAPMKVMAVIKDLPVGGSYTFPDGTTIYQKDVVEPARDGRKIVICGDTADSRAIGGLAMGADVLIHEATNAFLNGIDKDTSRKMVLKDATIHGHSTPGMAGYFAKKIGAKRLILNHFSSRYKGDQSLESISIMTRIEQEAIQASGLEEDKVAAAWDFMVLPVPQN